jgi:hypothetical protein
MQHIFYEYHNYQIKSSYTTRLSILLFSNLIATLITNPIDVCLSKILTQKPHQKYTGLFMAMRTVYKEEGYFKLFFGGIHPRFMFNLYNGCMFLFIYDRFTHYMSE